MSQKIVVPSAMITVWILVILKDISYVKLYSEYKYRQQTSTRNSILKVIIVNSKQITYMPMYILIYATSRQPVESLLNYSPEDTGCLSAA